MIGMFLVPICTRKGLCNPSKPDDERYTRSENSVYNAHRSVNPANTLSFLRGTGVHRLKSGSQARLDRTTLIPVIPQEAGVDPANAGQG